MMSRVRYTVLRTEDDDNEPQAIVQNVKAQKRFVGKASDCNEGTILL